MTAPSLVPLVDDYLSVRRRMGYQLNKPARLLLDFACYADQIGHRGPITTDLAMGWALSRCGDPARAAWRLSAVRGFARHRAAYDPDTEIPPTGLLGEHHRRAQPHIYSDAEIAALLDEAGRLLPRRGLCPRTYVALFSLLASTGMRPCEACRLEIGDVDLVEGVLTIRRTKFRKQRLVPLHPTTTEALACYAADRDMRPNPSSSDRFFRTERAPVLRSATVHATFTGLRQRLGWAADGRTRRPRVVDLRHTFAVRRLLAWYADGIDVNTKILALSTYLGHASPASTYWYLTAVPELMAIASTRFEHFARYRRVGDAP